MMFNAGEMMLMDVSGHKKGLDELSSFSKFSMELSHFLVGVPELLI